MGYTLKELQKKYARLNRRYPKARSMIAVKNAGNVLYNNAFFNQAMGNSDPSANISGVGTADGGIGMAAPAGGGMGEGLDKNIEINFSKACKRMCKEKWNGDKDQMNKDIAEEIASMNKKKLKEDHFDRSKLTPQMRKLSDKLNDWALPYIKEGLFDYLLVWSDDGKTYSTLVKDSSRIEELKSSIEALGPEFKVTIPDPTHIKIEVEEKEMESLNEGKHINSKDMDRVLNIVMEIDPDIEDDVNADDIYHEDAYIIKLDGDGKVWDSDLFDPAYKELYNKVKKAINDEADRYWSEVDKKFKAAINSEKKVNENINTAVWVHIIDEDEWKPWGTVGDDFDLEIFKDALLKKHGDRYDDVTVRPNDGRKHLDEATHQEKINNLESKLKSLKAGEQIKLHGNGDRFGYTTMVIEKNPKFVNHFHIWLENNSGERANEAEHSTLKNVLYWAKCYDEMQGDEMNEAMIQEYTVTYFKNTQARYRGTASKEELEDEIVTVDIEADSDLDALKTAVVIQGDYDPDDEHDQEEIDELLDELNTVGKCKKYLDQTDFTGGEFVILSIKKGSKAIYESDFDVSDYLEDDEDDEDWERALKILGQPIPKDGLEEDYYTSSVDTLADEYQLQFSPENRGRVWRDIYTKTGDKSLTDEVIAELKSRYYGTVNKKHLKEGAEEGEEFYFEDVEVEYDSHSGTESTYTSVTLKKDKNELIEILQDEILPTKPRYIEIFEWPEDQFEAYMEEHWKELTEKFYNEIHDYLEDEAKEQAKEEIDWSEVDDYYSRQDQDRDEYYRTITEKNEACKCSMFDDLDDPEYITENTYDDLGEIATDLPRYEYIQEKEVYDSDGFLTQYVEYKDNSTGKYVFIFGDEDLYNPENASPDHISDTEEEADQWFDDYMGPYNAAHAAEWMERHPYGYYNDENDYGEDSEDDLDEAVHNESLPVSDKSLQYYIDIFGFNPFTTKFSKKAQGVIDKFAYVGKVPELFDYLAAGITEPFKSAAEFDRYIADTDVADFEIYNGPLNEDWDIHRDDDLMDLSDEDTNYWAAQRDADEAAWRDEEEYRANIEEDWIHPGKGGMIKYWQDELKRFSGKDDIISRDNVKVIKNNLKRLGADLDEGLMSDLNVEIQEAGGEENLIDKLQKDIKALKSEEYFLTDIAPHEVSRGGAFESQEEIDQALDETRRELRKAQAKLGLLGGRN